MKSIVRFINRMKGKSGIIYTLNRKTTEELADIVNGKWYQSRCLSCRA